MHPLFHEKYMPFVSLYTKLVTDIYRNESYLYYERISPCRLSTIIYIFEGYDNMINLDDLTAFLYYTRNTNIINLYDLDITERIVFLISENIPFVDIDTYVLDAESLYYISK